MIGLSKLQLMYCNMSLCGRVPCFCRTAFISALLQFDELQLQLFFFYIFEKSNFNRLSSLKVLFLVYSLLLVLLLGTLTLVDIVVISSLNIANIFKHFREMVTFLAFTFFGHSESFLILDWLVTVMFFPCSPSLSLSAPSVMRSV